MNHFASWHFASWHWNSWHFGGQGGAGPNPPATNDWAPSGMNDVGWRFNA